MGVPYPETVLLHRNVLGGGPMNDGRTDRNESGTLVYVAWRPGSLRTYYKLIILL
jgi:hypothetical protein